MINLQEGQKIFVISDTHFGHANILRFESKYRGHFKSIQYHDEYMIDGWNSIVSKNDVVIHCGDFCYWKGSVKPSDYTKKLNGNIYLIQGNHDQKITPWNYKEEGFEYYNNFLIYNKILFIHQPIYLEKYIKYKPLATKDIYIKSYHGHVHTGIESLPNPQFHNGIKYVNVSCELSELKPIELTEVEKKLCVSTQT